MVAVEQFEGETIFRAILTCGAFRFSTSEPIRKHQEVVLVVRAKVDSIEFPHGETPVRLQKSKVVRTEAGEVKMTMAALVTDPEQRDQLVAWLVDEVEAREGVQRLRGDDGPDWLNENPIGTETVELGDGSARVRRPKRRKPAEEPHDPNLPAPIDGEAPIEDRIDEVLGVVPEPAGGWPEEPAMSDDEWEASARG